MKRLSSLQTNDQLTRYVVKPFFDALTPDPILTVSEWADEHRVLSQKASAEPGRWRTSRTPYLREIMDCLSPSSPIEEVIFIKGSQIGGTEGGTNWIAFIIDHCPGPTMAVQPTVDLAKKYSKQRIAALIEESPRLRAKVKSSRSRDSGNTVLTKEFQGGLLAMTGANSAVGLRSLPIKNLFLDEVDAYPDDVDGEGDPVALAKGRTKTFSRRKILQVSTPTFEGRSKIKNAYDQSDQRVYMIPCPHCNEYQSLKWSNLRWPEGKPEEVQYMCEACGVGIEEHHKTKMLEKGKWIQRNPGARGAKVAGFHINTLYSPVGWYSWVECVRDFLEAQGNPDKLRTFVNTILGETWKESGDAPEWNRIYSRRENYKQNTLPVGVLFLTVGVDVQKDRLECEIVGWGRGQESWSIDFRVIMGDTATDEPWAELSKLTQETFIHETGTQIGIRMTAVDSGYNTQHVYNWVRNQAPDRVAAVKGIDTGAVMIGAPKAVDVSTKTGKAIRRGLRVWPITVGHIKSELYARLKLNVPTDGKVYPAGFCHFPMYGEEYFKQITAEQIVVRLVKGFRKYSWEKTRDRNEALDCFDGETEVLTEKGWRKFPDAQGIRLATVNMETDEIQYQIPTQYIQREHSGEMIEIKTRRLDILVTPNHRMVTYQNARIKGKVTAQVPPKITLAKNLNRHMRIKTTAKWVGEDVYDVIVPASYKGGSQSNVQIEPERSISSEDAAELLGWYISEGSRSLIRSKTQKNLRHKVNIAQNVDRCASLEGLLERLPWKFRRYRSRRGSQNICFTITSKQLYEFLGACGDGAGSKVVPVWLKNSSSRIIEKFLDSAFMGDGWRNGEQRRWCTISKTLAGDYQELILKCGRGANILYKPATQYLIRGRQGTNTKPQYHVSELVSQTASIDGGGNGKRDCLAKPVSFQGMVYCYEVPNGTLVCRRNGKAFIAGNCRVYARAAAALLGIDRMKTENWDELAQKLGLFTEKTPKNEDSGEASENKNEGENPKPRKVQSRSSRIQNSFWRKD